MSLNLSIILLSDIWNVLNKNVPIAILQNPMKTPIIIIRMRFIAKQVFKYNIVMHN